jgi:hypothetical protein
MSDLLGIRSDIADLKVSVDALTQGLQLMVETQHTHTELLEQILAAATEPSPADSPLHDLLARMIAALDGQTEALGRIEVRLGRVGRDVENAVVRGIQLAAGDGVDVGE